MIVRLLASVLLLVTFTGCKSFDIFVKAFQTNEESKLAPTPQAMQYTPENSGQQASINAPERAPASTIICSNGQERRAGNKMIVRKECTDMDGVLESNDGAAALAEW